MGESTDSRDQPLNRVRAFQRLRDTPEWKSWFREAIFIAQGRKSTEQLVDETMAPENIRTQVLVGSKWVDITDVQG